MGLYLIVVFVLPVLSFAMPFQKYFKEINGAYFSA